MGPTNNTNVINKSASPALMLLKIKIPLSSPLYTLVHMRKVTIAIMAICSPKPSCMLVNSEIDEDTIAVPNPKPVADVAITPSKNKRSTTRPGHMVILELRTGSQAALKRRTGFLFM